MLVTSILTPVNLKSGNNAPVDKILLSAMLSDLSSEVQRPPPCRGPASSGRFPDSRASLSLTRLQLEVIFFGGSR